MTKEITIAGFAFAVSQPFVAGHVISEAEAKALNQVRAENIRNNMASKVKAAHTEPTEELNADNIASIVAAYDAEYVFTLASVGGGKRVTDPVEVEARKIARAIFTEALKGKGIAIKNLDKEIVDNKIAEIAERADVIKQARKSVEQRAKQAEDILSGMDLPATAVATEGQVEGETESGEAQAAE